MKNILVVDDVATNLIMIENALKDLPYDFFPVNCNYINDISIYIYCNTLVLN